MTAWNPAIPNPSNVPANDATSMNGNILVLDAAFTVDHVNLALATNQGFHKQISLNTVGTSPYTVAGLQSYEYSKALPSNVRTYLEYQPSGPDVFGGAPAKVPLSFKAYISFVPAGLVQKRNFNVASVAFGLPGSTWTITFNEVMPDAFYSAFVSFYSTSFADTLIVTSQASNVLTVRANTGNNIQLISIAVM